MPDRYFWDVAHMSRKEFSRDPPPGFEYEPDPKRWIGMREPRNGVTILTTDFFLRPPGEDRLFLLYHELGHDLLKLRFNDWWYDVMEPFFINRRGDVDNPYGADSRPEEMIADAYSVLVLGNADTWFEGEKYVNFMDRLKEAAEELGLPIALP